MKEQPGEKDHQAVAAEGTKNKEIEEEEEEEEEEAKFAKISESIDEKPLTAPYFTMHEIKYFYYLLYWFSSVLCLGRSL
jgi:hypothetical protein